MLRAQDVVGSGSFVSGAVKSNSSCDLRTSVSP